ncbi:MAG: hypothetical protein JRJ85_13130 [Deltaproteobacteria bacterium]|nr:hypothetical protein [Deltaproteobacteria bacterium]
MSENPLIILDGAHNPGAVREVRETIRHRIPNKRLILVMGVMEDKDISKILRIIVPAASHVSYTRPEYYRSALPERLMQEASHLGVAGEILPSVPEAIEKAQKMADPDDIILVSGSLFTIGEALTYFDATKYKPDEPLSF